MILILLCCAGYLLAAWLLLYVIRPAPGRHLGLLASLLFPPLGLIWALWQRLRYVPVTAVPWLAEHREAIFEPVANHSEVRRQARADAQAEALAPELAVPRPGGHQHVIVALNQHRLPHSGRLLAQALASPHTDTVHYAATTWLAQRQALQAAVHDAVAGYTAGPAVQTGQVWLNAYSALLASDLLNTHEQTRLRQEEQAASAQLHRDFPKHAEFWLAAIHNALTQGDYARADRLLTAADQHGHRGGRFRFARLERAYRAQQWPAVHAQLAGFTSRDQTALLPAEHAALAMIGGRTVEVH